VHRSRFRQPLHTDRPIHGVGRVTDIKGRLLLAESRITDADGETIAEATGKMMNVPARID
jgi:acyl-coenzyme A thioesterase PaaI-like protein